MHSGAITFCWLCVVIGLQVVGALPLTVLLASMLLIFDTAQRRHWWRLVRRSRWLIVVLAVTFFLTVPGEALWPGVPGTVEGLSAALEHGGRFVMILAAVAWLLDGRSRSELMAGMYSLAGPVRRLGIGTDRAVARMALVLAIIDSDSGRDDWRSLLGGPVVVETRWIELDLQAWRPVDFIFCATAFTIVGLGLAA